MVQRKCHAVCYWDLCSVFKLLLLFTQIYFIFSRKELILSGTLNPLKDLHLGKLALTKFPKSPETWIHRLVSFAFYWLLKQFSWGFFICCSWVEENHRCRRITRNISDSLNQSLQNTVLWLLKLPVYILHLELKSCTFFAARFLSKLWRGDILP